MNVPLDAGQVDAHRRYREAVTLMLADDPLEAVRTVNAAEDPIMLCCALLAALTDFVTATAEVIDRPPLDVWRQYSLGVTLDSGV